MEGGIFRLFRAPVFSIAILLGMIANVEAQLEEAENPLPRAPFVGLAVGAGGLPITFFNGCVLEDRFGTLSTSMSASFSIGVPVGPLSILTQTTANGEAVFGAQDHCVSVEPAHESGTHVDRLSGVETGFVSTTDLRLRYEFPMQYPLAASVGGGWVWTQKIPFWTASMGVRTPGRLRWGLDLALERYRMPFELVTREWENLKVLRVLGQESEREWQGAWQLRLGAEWLLR